MEINDILICGFVFSSSEKIIKWDGEVESKILKVILPNFSFSHFLAFSIVIYIERERERSVIERENMRI